MTAEAYKVKVADIFEGPMDLLLHLIKKNEVDIYDIPIALITDQFLAYIEWMKSLDIDVAGDFLVMAATLTQIKSRMLLPFREESGNSAQEEDPRSEITGPLIEYMQMKYAAEQLASRPMLEEDVFTRKNGKPDSSADPSETEIQADIASLFSAYQSLLKKISGREGLNIEFERISVKEKITEVMDAVEKKGSVAFEALVPENPGRSDIIITFLAVLEIVKLNLVRLVQSGPGIHLQLISREPRFPGRAAEKTQTFHA